ncbi:MAG TPA: DUF4397 domain-containing protein [Gemmatimonadaceae bacterium]|nr:DUF4397 domain-containing protein [Gemmatimonadaceae bacterium]
MPYRQRQTRRTLSAVLLLLAAALGAAACDDDDPASPGPGAAQLRFVNAAPGAGAVTVKWDNSDAFTAVGYGSSAAAYKTVDAGVRSVKVRAAAATTDLATGDVTAKRDEPYTVLLVKEGTAHSVVALADTNTAPAAGKARLRIAHAAPAANGSVDVYVTAPGADLAAATPSAAGVQLKKASKYLDVDAGDRQLRLTAAGAKTVLLDAGTLSLTSGQVRTVVALEADAGGTPLKAVVLQDRNP